MKTPQDDYRYAISLYLKNQIVSNLINDIKEIRGEISGQDLWTELKEHMHYNHGTVSPGHDGDMVSYQVDQAVAKRLTELSDVECLLLWTDTQGFVDFDEEDYLEFYDPDAPRFSGCVLPARDEIESHLQREYSGLLFAKAIDAWSEE